MIFFLCNFICLSPSPEHKFFKEIVKYLIILVSNYAYKEQVKKRAG